MKLASFLGSAFVPGSPFRENSGERARPAGASAACGGTPRPACGRQSPPGGTAPAARCIRRIPRNLLRVGLLLPGLTFAAAAAFGQTATPAMEEPAAVPITQVQYLSGHGANDAVLWDFYCTGGRHSGVWTKIAVPSCWEQQGFGTYQYGLVLRDKGAHPPGLADEQGRYRLTFTVPAAWRGRTVRLVFAGSMTDTEAWVNGRLAGPIHQGAFYQFKYDITRLLKFGEPNLLEVTVSKESANRSVNEAERRGDYWNFGGIFRPVYLEALPAHAIERTAIDARADGSFHAEVFLGPQAAGPVTVRAQILTTAGEPVGAPFVAAVPPGGTVADLHARIAGVKLWTAETPNLYHARFTLLDGTSPQHAVVAEFGFRTFEVRPHDGLYLNGVKIRLKGLNRHSFWSETGRTLSRRLNYTDVRLMKEMNLNAVRMSHYPPDADFLEACDRLGLYVLDELGGWHGHYDTPTGRKLIGEMVRRDVNHPSILFWDNGNEGGWNTANDGQFDRWDIQGRPVLHPLGDFSHIATMHYRSYPQTQAYCRGPDIFMPTEFLHGNYDGGLGAGLWDYWELMRNSPLCAGGFMWAFLDEGVARTDQNGRIDVAGNFAPDGIVGPHREREGSFYTVRQVWSPVQVGPDRLPENFNGALTVENRYDFTNLDQCTFTWKLADFPGPQDHRAGHTVIARGEMPGPSVAPQTVGVLKIALPADWRAAGALYVTARDPKGRALWTWSWSWRPNRDFFHPYPAPYAAAHLREAGTEVFVDAGTLELCFDRTSGRLAGVSVAGKPLSFGGGPRFFAARRGDRRADGTVDANAPKGANVRYEIVSPPGVLTGFSAKNDGDDAVVEADYSGPLQQARWRISATGGVRLDYTYDYEGVTELMGVDFDYPEAKVKSIRWLGRGPYRVWQNRLRGTTLDVWQNAYNDTVTGQSWIYPEFKGYFRGWKWARFATTEGAFTLENETPHSYLGVYTPGHADVGPLCILPQTGIAVLTVIPAMRNKVNETDLIGPHSQPQWVGGVHHGVIRFHFETNP